MLGFFFFLVIKTFLCTKKTSVSQFIKNIQLIMYLSNCYDNQTEFGVQIKGNKIMAFFNEENFTGALKDSHFSLQLPRKKTLGFWYIIIFMHHQVNFNSRQPLPRFSKYRISRSDLSFPGEALDLCILPKTSQAGSFPVKHSGGIKLSASAGRYST